MTALFGQTPAVHAEIDTLIALLTAAIFLVVLVAWFIREEGKKLHRSS